MASGLDFSSYRQGMDNLIARYDKCLHKFGHYVGNQRTDVQKYPCAFLVSIYGRSPKERGKLTFWLTLKFHCKYNLEYDA
jgi:hypothetical protein